MLKCYHPEMGEAKPEANIEAHLSHYGKHYYLKTPLTLAGRGIRLIEQLTADKLVPGSKQVGWFYYKVTNAAFEKIKEQYEVSMELLLD